MAGLKNKIIIASTEPEARKVLEEIMRMSGRKKAAPKKRAKKK